MAERFLCRSSLEYWFWWCNASTRVENFLLVSGRMACRAHFVRWKDKMFQRRWAQGIILRFRNVATLRARLQIWKDEIILRRKQERSKKRYFDVLKDFTHANQEARRVMLRTILPYLKKQAFNTRKNLFAMVQYHLKRC